MTKLNPVFGEFNANAKVWHEKLVLAGYGVVDINSDGASTYVNYGTEVVNGCVRSTYVHYWKEDAFLVVFISGVEVVREYGE
jgi:hypothetical protein